MASSTSTADALFWLHADLVLPDRIVPRGWLAVRQGRIAAVLAADDHAAPRLAETVAADPPAPAPSLTGQGSRWVAPASAVRQTLAGQTVIDAPDHFLVPGYVDLHVHGGAGHDFMDGTPEAFNGVLAAHLAHGTTSLTPTTTVARHEQILAALELSRQFQQRDAAELPRVLGAHFYGPYFREEARGCHPRDPIRPPHREEFEAYLAHADALATATIAPEVPGAEAFACACRERGVRVNIGHSHATFDQVAAAIGWGARHVDHLYCAMSDKARLRQQLPYPMRGGVLEATLLFDELTTEVIADGKHLSADLLRLALKIKGPDRLALVTDASRALDCPDGRYLFGPVDGGVEFDRRDGVGIMPDGLALAWSVQGMDHMVRTLVALVGCDLPTAVRMATLTPARILGVDDRLGSLAVGRYADLVLLDRQLHVQAVYRAGQRVAGASGVSRSRAPRPPSGTQPGGTCEPFGGPI